MNPDDMIRSTLAEHERDVAPDSPAGRAPEDPLAAITTAVRRRRDTRTAFLAGIAVLLVALGLPLTLINVSPGAGPAGPLPSVLRSATPTGSPTASPQRSGPQPPPSPGRSTVPWLAAPANAPSLPATGPLPAARPCTAADLPTTATIAPVGPGISEENGVILQVRNVGKSRCTLDGVPGVYYRASGHTTVRTSTHDPITAGAWVPATVNPGQTALVRVTRTFTCKNPAPGIGNSVVANGISWAGKNISFSTHSFAGACPDFMVSAWYSEAAQSVFPAHSWDALTATLDTASMHVEGVKLYFTVVLTNPTDTSIRLVPCPVYTIHVLDSSQWYKLNCAAQPLIPAHASIGFAMQADLTGLAGLPVTSDAATPPHSFAPTQQLYKFSWSLDATPPDVLIIAAGAIIG